MSKRFFLLIGLAVFVLIMVVLLFLLVFSVDSIVKAAIESYGSEVIGTRVSVGSVEISLSEGKGTIRGLRFANPEGFTGDHAFSLEEVTVDLEANSLGQSPLILTEVRVIAPEALVESDEDKKVNFKILADNIKRSTDAGTEPEDSDDIRLSINRFVFEEGLVQVRSPLLEDDTEVDFPALSLSDLGGKEGVPPRFTAQTVLRAFVNACIGAASRSGLERIIDEKLGGEMGEKAKEILRGILK